MEAVEVTDQDTGAKRPARLGPVCGHRPGPGQRPLRPAPGPGHYGYVLAGEDCLTNVPGVFAAGDSRTKLLRQIVTAVADGAVAAMQAERFLHG